MHWSKTESSKWSLDCVSTRPGHPLYVQNVSRVRDARAGRERRQTRGADRAGRRGRPRLRAEGCDPFVPLLCMYSDHTHDHTCLSRRPPTFKFHVNYIDHGTTSLLRSVRESPVSPGRGAVDFGEPAADGSPSTATCCAPSSPRACQARRIHAAVQSSSALQSSSNGHLTKIPRPPRMSSIDKEYSTMPTQV